MCSVRVCVRECVWSCEYSTSVGVGCASMGFEFEFCVGVLVNWIGLRAGTSQA